MITVKYGTEKHRVIYRALKDRFDLSKRYMEQRYGTWESADKKYQAYMPEKAADAARRLLRENTGEPQITTFEVPYSYAMLMSAHTYWTSVFLSRSPINQFTARHGEGQRSVLGVEALLDYQVNVGKMMVPYYIWLLDVGKYGLGIVGSYWADEEIRVAEEVEEEILYLGLIPSGQTKKKKVTRTMKGYQGNRLFNIRPQDFFPDPRVPISRLQEGEFVGRMTDVGWNTILKREASGIYFNIDALRKVRRNANMREQGGVAQQFPAGLEHNDLSADISDMNNVELLEMSVELVPTEWGLGSSKHPEKWVFTLAAGEVVIGMEPLGRYHNKFEFHVLEYEVDGYALHKRGMLEILDPMQDVMTTLMNTHLTNVRKGVNDQFIVDPSRLMMKDLLDPKAGKLVRLKPEAYGTDPRQAIHQLQFYDVTQQNFNSMQEVSALMQKVVGVNENMMSAVNSGGRKTATEVRSSTTMGINRMKTAAEYFSAMGFAPQAEIMLQTTQQYYDIERKFKIAGNMLSPSGPDMMVSPEDIQGFYDFVAVDGTMPVDRYAQANLWTQMLNQMRQMPELMAQYDVGGIFGWVAQLSGLKSIDQFRINARPDRDIERDLQAGNIVGAEDAARAGVGRADLGRVQNAGQIPGVGPTG